MARWIVHGVYTVRQCTLCGLAALCFLKRRQHGAGVTYKDMDQGQWKPGQSLSILSVWGLGESLRTCGALSPAGGTWPGLGAVIV